MSTQESYESRGSGWLTFAAMVMFAVGFLRIITAIAEFSDSHKVNNLTFGLFGDNLWAWGLWDLIIAALALYAGYSLFSNGTFGRVIGYIWAIVVIVQAFTYMEWAPWFAVTMIALGGIVIYGLAVSSDSTAEL